MATATQPVSMQPEPIQADLEPLQEIEALLSDSRLLPAPRALLLLRMCQFAQLFHQDRLAQYWAKLMAESQHVPKAHLEAFEGLKATIEPGSHRESRGFAGEFMAKLDEAVKLAQTDRDAAGLRFQQCAEQIEKRWWWPFGKKELWNALLVCWAEVDRRAPLERIAHLSPSAQENLLTRWNLKEPFTTEEWLLASDSAHGPAIRAALAILEKNDDPKLLLPSVLCDELAQYILEDIHPAAGNSDNWQLNAKRRKGLRMYLKLIQCALKQSQEAGASLLRTAYTATLTTKYFGEAWSERFTSLQLWLKVWAGPPELRDSAMSAIEETPAYLRDFALAQWYASIPGKEEEIQSAWDSLNAKCSDHVTSQGWFLVTLVGRGFGQKALQLAAASSQPAALMAQLRRAWLIEHQETVRQGVTPQELENDLVGQFLYRDSRVERMELLRTLTHSGMNPLPKEFWCNLDKFIGSLVGHKEIAGAAPNWYLKTTTESDQFKECLRLKGHGNYLFEDIDPLLLAALVVWDENYPSETKVVFESMWKEIRPTDFALTMDLFRSGVFERCQGVLCASPRTYQRLFVKWVTEKLVDHPLQTQMANTIYTLSLKNTTPFLFSLLGAQKLGSCSAKRCDEMLEIALAEYTATEELIAAAAELYTPGHGLKALQWTLPAKNQQYASAWQVGIVEACSAEILAAFLGHPHQPEQKAA